MRTIKLILRNSIVTVTALIVAGLVSLSGCWNNDEAPQATLPFAGLKIRVAVPAGGDFRTSWDVLIREWEAQNDAEVEIVEVTYDPDSESSTGIAKAYKSTQPTVSFFPLRHLSNFEAAGLCQPLPTEELGESKFNWYDIFPGLRDQILSLEGKPTAIATSCSTLKLFYRKDLLEAANLDIPSTWQQYDHLVAAIETWAPGLKVAEPNSGEFLLPLYFSRAFSKAKHPGNFSLLFDIYSGEALIDSPAFVETLSEFATHRDTDVFIDRKLNPTDCLKELLEGRAAIAIAAEHHSVDEQFARDEDLLIGCVQMPGSLRVYNSTTEAWEDLAEDSVNRVPVTAFDGFCATVTNNVNELQSLAALNLVRRLSMPTPTSGFEQGGRRSLCRSSWYATAEIWMTDSLTGNEKLETLDATSSMLSNEQVQSYAPFHDADIYFIELNKAVRVVLQKESEPADALAKVNEKWNALSGKDRQLLINSYRRRLGLRPTTLPKDS